MSKNWIWLSLLLLPSMAMAQSTNVAPNATAAASQLAAPEAAQVSDTLPLAETSAGATKPNVGGEAALVGSEQVTEQGSGQGQVKDASSTVIVGGTNSEQGAVITPATTAVEIAEQANQGAEPIAAPEEETGVLAGLMESRDRAIKFLKDGGPSIWAIAALSVITVALILWKIWRLALIGAWSRGRAGKAIKIYQQGDTAAALAIVQKRLGIRSKVVSAALEAITHLPEDRAREETARVAKRELASASSGLRALELIATIAPLLGLLGTVLGMIAAFQALQDAGSRADPAVLAGGIWEALLTTAAGMAVAIPAAASLTWFESVIERIRRDVEDGATVIFVRQTPQDDIRIAAE